MKILDRYVLWLFIKNYLISMMVLIGLYVLLDMVFNFDELVELRSQVDGGILGVLGIVVSIVDYYFFRSFLIFVYLSSIIPVVAAAFTLMRLSRFNELVAMLAAGVPLLRIAMPVIVAAVVLNMVLLPINQEVIIPSIIPKLIRKHDQLADASGHSYPIRWMQIGSHDLLSAGNYHPPGEKTPAVMQVVDVIRRDSNLIPTSHLIADEAVWEPAKRRWKLTNGRVIDSLRGAGTEVVERPVEYLEEGSVTPTEIALYRNTDFVEWLSTPQLNELIARDRTYARMELLRVKHFRWTQWFSNIVVLLLAIPCVLTREPGRLRAAAFKTVVLVGGCLATLFLSQQLATTPPSNPDLAARWPIYMAWLPIFLYAPVAAVMLDRVKT
jgi:lipopolysaccharide export system permease protein